MSENQQRSLGGVHVDIHAGKFSDMMPPDSGGVYCDFSMNYGLFSIVMVAQSDSGNRVAAFLETDYLVISNYVGSMHSCVKHVCSG